MLGQYGMGTKGKILTNNNNSTTITHLRSSNEEIR